MFEFYITPSAIAEASGLVVGIVLCLACIAKNLRASYIERIRRAVPSRDWFSVDDLAKRGFSRLRASNNLARLYAKGLVAARFDVRLSEEECRNVIEEWSYDGSFTVNGNTAVYFEFTFLPRSGGGHRNRRFSFGRLLPRGGRLSWAPTPVPIPIRR